MKLKICYYKMYGTINVSKESGKGKKKKLLSAACSMLLLNSTDLLSFLSQFSMFILFKL